MLNAPSPKINQFKYTPNFQDFEYISSNINPSIGPNRRRRERSRKRRASAVRAIENNITLTQPPTRTSQYNLYLIDRVQVILAFMFSLKIRVWFSIQCRDLLVPERDLCRVHLINVDFIRRPFRPKGENHEGLLVCSINELYSNGF